MVEKRWFKTVKQNIGFGDLVLKRSEFSKELASDPHSSKLSHRDPHFLAKEVPVVKINQVFQMVGSTGYQINVNRIKRSSLISSYNRKRYTHNSKKRDIRLDLNTNRNTVLTIYLYRVRDDEAEDVPVVLVRQQRGANQQG